MQIRLAAAWAHHRTRCVFSILLADTEAVAIGRTTSCAAQAEAGPQHGGRQERRQVQVVQREPGGAQTHRITTCELENAIFWQYVDLTLQLHSQRRD